MTIPESYPIHRCIYRNDAAALTELLKDNKMKELINEHDNHGNSPAQLALMLNRHNCINILMKNGCDIYGRNSFGWSAIDEATLIGNIDIIGGVTYIKWKELVERITEPGGLLEQWTATTPNLYLKYKAKVKTTIPFLQKLGYKDIHTFYKRGNSVRLDYTLGGFDTRSIPKVIRGKLSFLVKFEESAGIYKIYIIDHKEKTYQEFFPNMPEWYLTNSLNVKVSTSKLYKFFLDLSEFSLKERKGLLKKTTKTFNLENGKAYKCVQYRGKKVGLIIKKRYDEANIGECKSVINTKYEKGDSSSNKLSKLSKNNAYNKSTTSIHSNNTSSSVDNDSDDSDSELDDSDNESNYSDNEDTEIRPNEDRKTQTVSNFMTNICKQNEANKSHILNNTNNTVTYTVNKDGETKTFEKKTELEDTLDWEQAYCDKYSQSNDVVYNFLSGKKEEYEARKRLNHMDIVKMDLPKITEDEYFDPSSTEPLHLGRIMNITEERKSYNHKIKFWMAKESSHFPISAIDIKPIFELFMMVILDQVKSNKSTSDLDRIAYEYITQELINRTQKKHSFPVKISVPIYPSIAFQLTFLDCSKDINKVPDELFEIPKDYKNDNVFFKIIK